MSLFVREVRASSYRSLRAIRFPERLAVALARHGRLQPRTVVKKDGETWIEGLGLAGDLDDGE